MNKDCSTKWTGCIKTRIHQPVLKILTHLTRTAALNPWTTIACVVIVSFASLVIGFLTNANLDVDTDLLCTYIFVPATVPIIAMLTAFFLIHQGHQLVLIPPITSNGSHKRVASMAPYYSLPFSFIAMVKTYSAKS